MTQVTVNYWAVIVAAVAQMIVGFIWYAPALFGDIWMKLSGLSQADMKDANMPRIFGLSFVGSLVMAYVLAHFAYYAGAKDVNTGLQLGFWVWLGFVVTVMLSDVLYNRKPFKLYVLNISYHLVSLLVMGAILASWR